MTACVVYKLKKASCTMKRLLIFCWMLAVFILIPCGISDAAAPPRCLPDQWEAVAVGRVSEIASTSGGVLIFSLRYNQSFDFTRKLESTRQIVKIGNTIRRITTVTDWNKVKSLLQKMYKNWSHCII